VTNALKASDAALNPKARIKLVNKADAIMANDVPTIPLYQKPSYFVYMTSLKGLVDKPSNQGPTWNTETWKAG
jgi:peptide/nickel transport system substrate-binding protein